MKALITGASSGIGRDIARYLSALGCDLVIVARNRDKLLDLRKSLHTEVVVIDMDLSKKKNCLELYEMLKTEKIDILVNNAGYGVYGKFEDTDLETELALINLNIRAVHILTKLFLKDMKERDDGAFILNVSSSAAFVPGPLMASYYASKAYVQRLTESIYGELKGDQSSVNISALCPGPVATNFNKIAKVNFAMKPLSSKKVAKYAVDQMFKRKLLIIPGFKMKLVHFLADAVSLKTIIKINYKNQSEKIKEMP